MTRKHFLLLLLWLCATTVHAQYNRPENRIWVMGNKQGLDFTNPGTPVPFVSALANTNEACASVCNTNGQLLFYTNGMSVWDKNGTLMPKGNNNLIPTGSTLSTTQGAVIVPVPDSAGKYYLFSLPMNGQLYVNKIDMALNGGLGDVDTTYKLRKVLLRDGLTEKMIAIPGCNKSIWLLVHKTNQDSFFAFKVVDTGIDLNPVISHVGHFPGANYLQGDMKISTDRTKLLNCNFRSTAANNAGLEVFDFDFTTGIVSGGLLLDSASFYGGTFSPNGNVVYAQATGTSRAYQYDLTASVPSQTKLLLGPTGQYTDMKIGSDGIIYFGALAGSPGYNNYRYMGCIYQPDVVGVGCQFKDSVHALLFPNAAGTAGALSQQLPNEVVVPVADPATVYKVSLDTIVCAQVQQVTLHAPKGFDSYTWSDNSTDTMLDATQQGTYWVTSHMPCYSRVDTFIVKQSIIVPVQITVNIFRLGTTGSYKIYQWYKDGLLIPGATDSVYDVTQNARYSIKVTNDLGCTDSTSYLVTNVSVQDIANAGMNMRIYPNPASSTLHIDAPVNVTAVMTDMQGRVVHEQKNAAKININDLSEGMYIIKVTDTDGRVLRIEKILKVK